MKVGEYVEFCCRGQEVNGVVDALKDNGYVVVDGIAYEGFECKPVVKSKKRASMKRNMV